MLSEIKKGDEGHQFLFHLKLAFLFHLELAQADAVMFLAYGFAL